MGGRLISASLEGLIDPSDYPKDKLRVFGYMHELLLSVYIAKLELRVKYSQILWITDDHKFSRFNSLFYRSLCAGVFISLDQSVKQVF